jgi:hypothetical protein
MMLYTIDTPQADSVPVRDLYVDLDGTVFRLVLTWRERPACWYLDLYDSDGVALLMGQALRPGTAVLNRRSGAPWPAGQLMLIDQSGGNLPATMDGLGSSHALYYADSELIASLRMSATALTIEAA